MTSKFDRLLNIIKQNRKKYSVRPKDGMESKEGRVSKYGIDPANLEGGEHNISPELDPEEYRRLSDNDDERSFNIPFYKDKYGKAKKEPSDADLAEIETSQAAKKHTSHQKYAAKFAELDAEDDLKKRREKYRDGFRLMGRDEE